MKHPPCCCYVVLQCALRMSTYVSRVTGEPPISIMEDWRKSAEWQARIERVNQFLREYTKEGEGFSISYMRVATNSKL